MGADLRELRKFTISDFSGGLNEFSSSYKLKDNEVAAIKNMSLKDNGAIKTRKGVTAAQIQGGTNMTLPVRGMHRYVRADGEWRSMLYSGGHLWVDDDDFNYVRVPDSSAAILLSNDDYLRFTQYYDTVFFGGEREGLKLYNSDVSTTTLGEPIMACAGYGSEKFTASRQDTGGHFMQGDSLVKNVYYRFTFDWEFGDFLGESGPIYADHFDYIQYETVSVNFGAGSTDTQQVSLIRNSWDNIIGLANMTPARINIYRSVFYYTNSSEPGKENWSIDQYPFFHIGSISVDDYNDASVGSVVFTDGYIQPDYELEYNKMIFPPRARFMTIHLNKLWLAYVEYHVGDTEAWANDIHYKSDDTVAPHRLFISSIGNHGETEPAVFYTDQWVDIDPFGEGITGIHSFQNQVLVVFKANSMWAVLGDDASPRTRNISIRNISTNIGCIAPETIAEVEGRLVWLSNSGVFYWNGSGKPEPLKADNIEATINEIPSGIRRYACGIYDIKEREYLLAHGGPDTLGFNRIMERFHLRTGAWGQDRLGMGISSFMVKAQPDEQTYIEAGIGDVIAAQQARGSVQRVNDSYTSIAGSDIAFEFQTKFYDGGYPYMDKKFTHILFELSSPEALTFDVLCDNNLDTRTDSSEFTIPKPGTNDLVWWNAADTDNMHFYDSGTYDNVWAGAASDGVLVALDDRCWGKRISLIISGAVTRQVRIESITFFYKPKEGARF